MRPHKLHISLTLEASSVTSEGDTDRYKCIVYGYGERRAEGVQKMVELYLKEKNKSTSPHHHEAYLILHTGVTLQAEMYHGSHGSFR
jgi:hypothetical protein